MPLAPPASESEPAVVIAGVAIPTLLYGTAWKEDETARLTGLALAAGFRGIDTANQRKHYHEAEVGRAVRDWTAGGASQPPAAGPGSPSAGIGGARPFLQTKFTYRRGQDHRLPYDPQASLSEQVRQSCLSSLEHLGVDTIDAYLLHGPELNEGLSPGDVEVWRAMEGLQAEGRVRLLGVSNVRAHQLRALLAEARVPPSIVQNRLYLRANPYAEPLDRGVRGLCAAAGLVYEGFSILTANRETWAHPTVAGIARRLGVTPAQVLIRYAMSLGVLPLVGCTDPVHMRADLDVPALELTDQDLAEIARLTG